MLGLAPLCFKPWLGRSDVSDHKVVWRLMMDPTTKYQIALPITIACSAIGIIGGARGWKWLVDPHEDLALAWPPAMIKLLFGSAFLKRAVIVMGWIFLAYSIWLLIS